MRLLDRPSSRNPSQAIRGVVPVLIAPMPQGKAAALAAPTANLEARPPFVTTRTSHPKCSSNMVVQVQNLPHKPYQFRREVRLQASASPTRRSNAQLFDSPSRAIPVLVPAPTTRTVLAGAAVLAALTVVPVAPVRSATSLTSPLGWLMSIARPNNKKPASRQQISRKTCAMPISRCVAKGKLPTSLRMRKLINRPVPKKSPNSEIVHCRLKKLVSGSVVSIEAKALLHRIRRKRNHKAA